MKFVDQLADQKEEKGSVKLVERSEFSAPNKYCSTAINPDEGIPHEDVDPGFFQRPKFMLTNRQLDLVLQDAAQHFTDEGELCAAITALSLMNGRARIVHAK